MYWIYANLTSLTYTHTHTHTHTRTHIHTSKTPETYHISYRGLWIMRVQVHISGEKGERWLRETHVTSDRKRDRENEREGVGWMGFQVSNFKTEHSTSTPCRLAFPHGFTELPLALDKIQVTLTIWIVDIAQPWKMTRSSDKACPWFTMSKQIRFCFELARSRKPTYDSNFPKFQWRWVQYMQTTTCNFVVETKQRSRQGLKINGGDWILDDFSIHGYKEGGAKERKQLGYMILL